jgi:hypothetical protein
MGFDPELGLPDDELEEPIADSDLDGTMPGWELGTTEVDLDDTLAGRELGATATDLLVASVLVVTGLPVDGDLLVGGGLLGATVVGFWVVPFIMGPPFAGFLRKRPSCKLMPDLKEWVRTFLEKIRTT